MRTFRTIGIIGVSAVILFSAGVAFAQGRPSGALHNPGPAENASTTQSHFGQDAQDRFHGRAPGAVRPEPAQGILHNATTSASTTQSHFGQGEREKAKERAAHAEGRSKERVAQQLAGQLEKINKTWTDRFLRTLDRNSALLQKVQTGATTAAGHGKDVAATNAAIVAAKTAIANARTAVIAQAGKTYALTASSTADAVTTTTQNGQKELVRSLQAAFKNLHTALFNDLFALRDGPMKDARKAVQNALQTLKKNSRS